MDTTSTIQNEREGYKTFGFFLTDTELKLSGDRSRGKKGNNIYHAGLLSVSPNASPEQVAPWYRGGNNEPEYLIQLLLNNPVGLGLLFTKAAVMCGQGATLFRREGDELVALFEEEWDEEIREFAEANQIDDYLHALAMDEAMLGNCFTQAIHSTGSQVGGVKQKVKRLIRIDPVCTRVVIPEGDEIDSYVVAPSWGRVDNGGVKDLRTYSAYKYGLKKQPGSVIFHGRKMVAGFPFYSPPQWYGARKSIELQNEIPYWHVANVVNMFGLRVRVSVSQTYISQRMSSINPSTNTFYTEKEVKAEIRDILKDYCTNPDNVGKVLVDTYYYDEAAKAAVRDFMIDSISLDLADDAYTKLGEMITSFVTSAFGVDPGLASIVSSKGMSSGSEKTQAWNILDALCAQARRIILRPLRYAHRRNGWDPNLVWGFQNPRLVTKDIDKSGRTAPTHTQPTESD